MKPPFSVSTSAALSEKRLLWPKRILFLGENIFAWGSTGPDDGPLVYFWVRHAGEPASEKEAVKFVRACLRALKAPLPRQMDSSESGMQGERYSHFETHGVALAEWLETRLVTAPKGKAPVLPKAVKRMNPPRAPKLRPVPHTINTRRKEIILIGEGVFAGMDLVIFGLYHPETKGDYGQRERGELKFESPRFEIQEYLQAAAPADRQAFTKLFRKLVESATKLRLPQLKLIRDRFDDLSFATPPALAMWIVGEGRRRRIGQT